MRVRCLPAYDSHTRESIVTLMLISTSRCDFLGFFDNLGFGMRRKETCVDIALSEDDLCRFDASDSNAEINIRECELPLPDANPGRRQDADRLTETMRRWGGGILKIIRIPELLPFVMRKVVKGEHLDQLYPRQCCEEVGEGPQEDRVVVHAGDQHVAYPHAFPKFRSPAGESHHYVQFSAGETAMDVAVHAFQVEQDEIDIPHRLAAPIPHSVAAGIEGRVYTFGPAPRDNFRRESGLHERLAAG